jgi:hypothetical protein
MRLEYVGQAFLPTNCGRQECLPHDDSRLTIAAGPLYSVPLFYRSRWFSSHPIAGLLRQTARRLDRPFALVLLRSYYDAQKRSFGPRNGHRIGCNHRAGGGQ